MWSPVRPKPKQWMSAQHYCHCFSLLDCGAEPWFSSLHWLIFPVSCSSSLPCVCNLPQSVVWLLPVSLVPVFSLVLFVFWLLFFGPCILPPPFWINCTFGPTPWVCPMSAFHKSFYWTSLCAISVFGSKQCLASCTAIILNSDNLEVLHDSIIKLHRKATIIHADPTCSQTSLFTSSTCCSLFSTEGKQSV